MSLLNNVAVELFTLAANWDVSATGVVQTDARVAGTTVGVGGAGAVGRDLLLSDVGDIEVVVVSVLGDGDGGEGGDFVQKHLLLLWYSEQDMRIWAWLPILIWNSMHWSLHC